jgi:hypothetical protein
MISITLKVGEPHEVILRDSFFLMEQATRALFSFPNPYSHVVHNHHLVVKGKEIQPKLDIICEGYWLLNLAPTFGQHMEPPPQISNAKLTKNPTCLEYEVFICYFGWRGSGHHPTLVDTFHPRRLPPNGSQTPSEYEVGNHLGLHEHLWVDDVFNAPSSINFWTNNLNLMNSKFLTHCNDLHILWQMRLYD